MTDKNTDDSEEVNRRAFLKSSSVAAGVGLYVASPASAKSDDHSRVHLVETGVKYDVEPEPDSSFKAPTVSLDDRQEYFVDEQQNELYVLPSATEETANTLLNAKAVVRTPGNSVVASGIGKTVQVAAGNHLILPTALSSDLRPIEGIQLNKTYHRPEIPITVGDATSVQGQDVESSDRASVQFSRGQAHVKARRRTEFSDTREIVQSVTSHIAVRNRGSFDVIDVRDQ